MSGWWDAAALASIASSAIKNAQKKIDKVLDIKEEEALRAAQAASSMSTAELMQVGENLPDPSDDISAERGSSPASTSQPLPSTSSFIKSTSSSLGAVKLSSNENSKTDLADSSALISTNDDNVSVQELTADSSSLMVPVTEPMAMLSISPNVEQTEESTLSPASRTTLMDRSSENSKGMISSSEGTLEADSLRTDDECTIISEQNNENNNNSDDDNNHCDANVDARSGVAADEKQSPYGSHTPASSRSIESPNCSEATSSCMGSELVRVEVAASTSSDIEIVSTPSSCCVENYVPMQQHSGDSRHFRPLVPAGLTVDHSSSSSSSNNNSSSNEKREQASSSNDVTAAALMKQLTEMTRSLEKKDARLVELSDENTLLHTQLTEIRRQMETAAATEAAFGADTVRLLKNEIKDRDQIISEFREEGEKLSRQQAQSSALIKKLRAKEKDAESQLTEANRKNEELQAKITLLERNLTLRLENERQSSESVQQMTMAIKRMEREVAEKQQQLLESKQELETLEQRVSSAGDSSKERENRLLERIDQLGEVVRELEEKSLTLERQKKTEVAELEAKLEASASLAEELRQGASSAAMPVVKQLESLQQSYALASKNWNETERSLTLKVAHLEQALNQAETRAVEAESSAATSDRKRSDYERSFDQCRTELTRIQASLVQIEADRDVWKRRVANLETMCEQERARAAGYERRATESESRLSFSSSSNQRRCTELESSLQKFERDYKDLTVRYDKLLEMYGEKAEEAEELKADVSELRQVFRDHFANYGSPSNSNDTNNSMVKTPVAGEDFT